MRYGRRRRSFPWGRVLWVALAVSGALSLLLVAVNWRSAAGLYRLNRVAAAVRRLEGTVELTPAGLRDRRLTAPEAVTQLQRALAELGLTNRLALRR
ncbi:MAG TPA: hypothetical protein GXX28_00775 [Firmicutes bacterium]|nr:hypothetical protein [Bacillota bacterium]